MVCREKRMFLLFIVFICLCLLTPVAVSARDIIGGKYLSSAGRTIILELDVKGTSTSNLIVHQFLSTGIDIVNSSPPLVKFDPKNGKAQWLIKNVRPGIIRITMDLAEAIPPGQVRAEVRCRDQQTGQMMDITINP